VTSARGADVTVPSSAGAVFPESPLPGRRCLTKAAPLPPLVLTSSCGPGARGRPRAKGSRGPSIAWSSFLEAARSLSLSSTKATKGWLETCRGALADGRGVPGAPLEGPRCLVPAVPLPRLASRIGRPRARGGRQDRISRDQASHSRASSWPRRRPACPTRAFAKTRSELRSRSARDVGGSSGPAWMTTGLRRCDDHLTAVGYLSSWSGASRAVLSVPPARSTSRESSRGRGSRRPTEVTPAKSTAVSRRLAPCPG